MDMRDLDEAIAIYRTAFELPPSGYKDKISLLHNLSIALLFRWKHSKDTADNTEAILVSQKAINNIASQDILSRNVVFQVYMELRLEKYNQTAAKEHLDKAISLGMRADNEMPQDDPRRASIIYSLGSCLLARFKSEEGELKDLEKDVTTAMFNYMTDNLKDLKTIPALDPHNGKPPPDSDIDDVLANADDFLNRILFDHQKSSASQGPIISGYDAMLSYNFMSHPNAYDIAKYTVDLIPRLMFRSLQKSNKQRILSEAVGVASLAATVCTPLDRGLLAAIKCLEIGRGLIAGGLFEQYDISALQKQYPEQANSFLALQDRLVSHTSREFSRATTARVSIFETEDDGHRKPEQELNELLETIRSKPNFQRFRLPPSKHDMLQAAECSGPIVLLNWGGGRCDALLIKQSGFRVLELPHASQKFLSEELIEEHLSKLESLDTLAWLWDDIVCPVLNALGFTEPPSDDSWPHIWWIPTSRLAGLPLHAAGHHLKRNGETTLDRFISSYAASVKALIHSRRRGVLTAEEPLNLIAVAMKDTYGQVTLGNADDEINTVSNIVESETINCYRPLPYKDDVLSPIKTCQIFHFAGHDETHPTDPLQSKLLLKDWQNKPLTVESLLDTDLSSNTPFLSYLSACGTGQILNFRSNGESIHLANAFQLAGFRHVIGTLWSVDDEICVDIAKLTYKSLCRSGRIRDDTVSRGLHDAGVLNFKNCAVAQRSFR